jgi:hypothetical protein
MTIGKDGFGEYHRAAALTNPAGQRDRAGEGGGEALRRRIIGAPERGG